MNDPLTILGRPKFMFLPDSSYTVPGNLSCGCSVLFVNYNVNLNVSCFRLVDKCEDCANETSKPYSIPDGPFKW